MAALNPVSLTPPAPTTTRAVPLQISTDDAGNKLAYPSGNVVIVRDLTDDSTIVCTAHTTQVTCARLAPGGHLCASGDKEGNLNIWQIKGCIVKLNTKPIGGAIRDIAWTGDSERLFVVGEGKTSFGAAIGISGNSVGTVSGHEKGIMSCDMKKTRPFRAVTGGMDANLAFFEGTPYKFKNTIPGHHQNNVTAVKYNPAGDVVASVSGKDTIALVDGTTGEFKSTIATGHTGTILGVSWSPDGSQIATASADKSVKVHSVANGEQIFSTSFGKTVGDMQQGVTYYNGGIISVGFNNEINFLDKDSGAITKTFRMHAKGAKCMNFLPGSGKLLSVGREGSVIQWEDDACSKGLNYEGLDIDLAAGCAVTPNGASAVVAGGTSIFVLDNASRKATKLDDIGIGGIVDVAALNDSTFLALGRSQLAVITEGKKVAEHALDFAALSGQAGKSRMSGVAMAFHVETSTVAVGAEGHVFTFKLEEGGKVLTPSTVFAEHAKKGGTISALAFSKSGAAIASGDSTREILVWSTTDGNVLYNELVFHSSMVSSLAFNPASDDQLLSGSVDNSIIVWNLSAKKRIIQANAHTGGVLSVAFSPDGTQVLSSGGDGVLRKFAF